MASNGCKNCNWKSRHELGSIPIGIVNFLNQEAILEGICADKEKEHLLLVISFGYSFEGYNEKYQN